MKKNIQILQRIGTLFIASVCPYMAKVFLAMLIFYVIGLFSRLSDCLLLSIACFGSEIQGLSLTLQQVSKIKMRNDIILV